MENPLVRKLEQVVDLTDSDRRMLDEIGSSGRLITRKQDLIKEGESPKNVHLMMSGFACRYKLLPDGHRQIMAYLIPGDFCDLHIAILGQMDHSIATLGPSTVAYIPYETVLDLTENYPSITRALWWATLVDEAILREWIVGLGARPADRRVAHLLCELMVRLQSVGLVEDNSFHLPITQSEIGETLGVTIVHANRVLMQLTEMGFITRKRNQMTVCNPKALMEFAEFKDDYLHLRRLQATSRVFLERAAY
ncbi:Crp/Fnr family transcriptional regulator [Fulvimarina sp. MAC8]|uniref:Crp/Fnr family transcriptional regulator n=1 Tax=Fulvimarina sp. MAC8 TaxID=3162874 RepID=UPI0032ED58CA